jgi:Xaa-Pro aminopeptidase
MAIRTPFEAAEYADRISRTQWRMTDAGFDFLLVSDPANICYLTGFDACSFYVPQVLLVPQQGRLAFFCRHVDASSAWLTSNLAEDRVFGYAESCVQHPEVHPMDWVAETMRPWLGTSPVLAVEDESPFWTVRSHRSLLGGLGENVVVTPAASLVNWVRAVKSPAEIEMMRTAGRITEQLFTVADQVIRPGVRQCDAVAEIYAAGVHGLDDAGGAYPAVPPLVLAGANTAFPHVAWSDQPFGETEPIAVELSGCRHRYHAPVARTMFLGRPQAHLARLADITGEGLDAALATIRPGVTGHEVAAAWTAVIARHGMAKSGRIGYPVGIGFPSDWGERTMSLRAGDTTPLQAGMTFHVMIGKWLDGGGYSISETILITESGAECLASIPRTAGTHIDVNGASYVR